MPRIPVFEPRGNLPARSPSPYITGAAGAAVEGLGKSITRVGMIAAGEHEKVLKKQKDADNAAYFAKVSADAELASTQWIMERQQKATSKEEDFNLDDVNNYISEYYTERVKEARKAKFNDAANALVRDGERVRTNVMENAIKFKSKLNVSNRVSDLTDSANSIVNLVRVGGDFDKAKAKIIGLFTAAEQVLDPTHPFLNNRDNYISAVAGANVERLYESDTDETLKRLRDGEFNDDLLPGELDRLIKKGEMLKAQREVKLKADRKVIAKELDAVIDDIEKVQASGYEYNAGGQTVIDVAKQAKALGGKEGKEFLKRVKDSTEDAQFIRLFALQPLPQQAQTLADMRKETKQSARSLGRLNRAEKAYKNAVSEINAGRGLDHAAKLGVIEAVPSLDMTSGENLSESMRNRVKAADLAEAQFQTPVTPLNDSEVESFALILEKGTPEQDMSLLAALVGGAGSHAVPVMEMLSKKDKGIYAAAGGLVLDGAPEVALSVLRGLEQVKANKNILPKPLDFDAAYNSIVGTTYAGLPKQGALIKEAVRMVYADKAVRTGMLGGVLEDATIEAAVNALTGGIIERDSPGLFTGSHFIEAPERGMDDEGFEDWMDGLTEPDIEKMGGVLGIAPEKALELIKDESILSSVGKGLYTVKDRNDRWLLDKEGDPFVLDYGATQ